MPQTLKRIWRIARIPLGVVLLLYVGLVIYRVPAAFERQKTQDVVAQIHAQKLTLADVNGENLPPVPDPALVDTTIEGVDANKNGIRDDVELAIFKKYPDSARIRAAELQYAMALQNEMTSNVFNSETLIAVMQQEDRAYFCIGDAVPNQSPDILSKKTDDLAFNITTRKQRHQDIFSSYMSSFKSVGGLHCDIDLTSLPN